jgi:hypothetical protein
MNFEDEIRAALRRESPPPEFAARVVALAAQQRSVRVMPGWRSPATWALAAGIAVAALIPVGVVEHQNRERQRGLQARAELYTALRITRTKLQQTKERVRRATTRHAL